MPPKPIRTLRNLTRYRKSNIRDRPREANRLHKILEDTGIKLDCVASDLLGKSGRAMLDALVRELPDQTRLSLQRDEHRAPTRELLGACFIGARERQTTDGFPVAYAEACDLLRRISGDLIRISDLPAPRAGE